VTTASDDRKGLLWAFASAFGVALFVIPWKLANEAGDPAHSVLLLLGAAAILNTLFVIGRRIASGAGGIRIRRVDVGVAALLASFTLLGNLTSAWAIQDLSPALLNVVLRVDVTLIAILAWLFLGERVEPRFWPGTVVAVLGLVVMQGPMETGSLGQLFGAGIGMALAAAACFSAIGVLTRRFIHQIDPVGVNAVRLWMAVALWFPFNPMPRFSEIPAEQAFHAVLSAIVGPFLGRLCLMISARYVEARVSALVNLTAPVMTLALAFALLSDWPQRHELLGGAIMIAGISIPLLRRGG
jgi:drug/metabolite transporter (DMT)-like permease